MFEARMGTSCWIAGGLVTLGGWSAAPVRARSREQGSTAPTVFLLRYSVACETCSDSYSRGPGVSDACQPAPRLSTNSNSQMANGPPLNPLNHLNPPKNKAQGCIQSTRAPVPLTHGPSTPPPRPFSCIPDCPAPPIAKSFWHHLTLLGSPTPVHWANPLRLTDAHFAFRNHPVPPRRLRAWSRGSQDLGLNHPCSSRAATTPSSSVTRHSWYLYIDISTERAPLPIFVEFRCASLSFSHSTP